MVIEQLSETCVSVLRVMVFLIFVVAGLLWRLIDLSIFNRSFLLRKSKTRVLHVINIPAHRGMITDRLGVLLAISIPVDSVWINPKSFQATSIQLKQLAHLLHLSSSLIKQRIKKMEDHQFVYLKRGTPLFLAKEIQRLNIHGIFFNANISDIIQKEK